MNVKAKIVQVLMWAIRVLGAENNPLHLPDVVWEIARFARPICDRLDLICAAGTSGEYKRDRVYEQLLNTFPNASPWQLHMAILVARHYIGDAGAGLSHDLG